MKFKEYKKNVLADLYRYQGLSFIRAYLLIPGFKYTFYLRSYEYFSENFYLIAILVKLKLILMQRHYGILIPWNTKIGKGFYIGHFGCIVVNGAVVIGDNVNISHGVTIGLANRGKNKGTAIIGNKVYIGPGAKIVGHVKIGNNVAIGANAVVTHDIPDNACVGGVTAKLISMDGALDYVNRIVE